MMRDQITLASPPTCSRRASCRLLGIPSLGLTEAPHQAVQDFIAHLLHRPLDGALEYEHVGRAVALHDDASQSEQSRAVEATRVKPLAERVDRRHDDYAGQPGENAAHELLANEA